MQRKYGWSASEKRELKRLLKTNLLCTEIAEKLGKKPQTVRHQARQLGISPAKRAKKSGKMGAWNSKHSHLREKVMTYFLTHTWDETKKKFKLTQSEAKSLFTVGYRDPRLMHLRKDTRRNDVWSLDETLFLLQHAGIQPRIWIARKLKRGERHTVKEQVKRLNCGSRYINGVPTKWAELLLRKTVDTGMKVKAGPRGPHGNVDCRPILITWVDLYSKAKRCSHIPDHIVAAIGVMATFQKKIHGTKGIKDTVESVKICLRRS